MTQGPRAVAAGPARTRRIASLAVTGALALIVGGLSGGAGLLWGCRGDGPQPPSKTGPAAAPAPASAPAAAPASAAAAAKQPAAAPARPQEPVDDGSCTDPLSDACRRRCAERDALACSRLAKADFAAAVTVTRQACAGEAYANCARLAREMMGGADYVLGNVLLTVLCESEDGSACEALSRSYAQGRGVPADSSRASELSERACEVGNRGVCRSIGVALWRRQGSTEADKARTRSLLLRGCAGDMAGPCVREATEAHESGEDKLAAALLAAACDNDSAEACSNLGFLYERGLGVAEDRAAALELYRRACDGGSSAGCRNVAIFKEMGTETEKDPAEAADLYRRACDAGEAAACRNLASNYAHGVGVPKDPEQVKRLLVPGCAGTEGAAACAKLAAAAERGQDYALAVPAWQAGCAAGDQDACVGLGVRVYDGVGISRDPNKAFELFLAACEARHPVGCRNAATQYGEGDGAPLDDEKAAAFYAKGCEVNDPPSCRSLGHRRLAGAGVTADRDIALALFKKACDGGMQEACDDLADPP